MPIDSMKASNTTDAETMFVVRDPDHLYSHSEVCELLEAAERLGFSLKKGSELGRMTVRELEVLVRRRQ